MSLSQSSLDVAQWLLTTSGNALVTCGRDPINKAYVAAGQIAWDDCCGMLVVAPERVYQSEIFPQPNTSQTYCFGGYLAVDYVVLLVRCTPTVDDRGRAPSETELQAAYDSLLGDAAVIFNSLTTEMPSEWIRTVPVQTFTGAQGGCIGVETRMTVGIEQSQWAVCCGEPAPHVPGDPICQLPASLIRFEPCEGLVSTNVQDAICELSSVVQSGPVEFSVQGGTIDGTQPTFDGVPLFSGHYIRTGDLVYFDIQVEFTNITSFGTGQYYLDLPFPSRYGKQARDGCLHDDSVSRQYGISGHVFAGQSELTLNYTASNGRDEPFTHNAPTQLSTADRFHISGTYIAEPLP